MRVLLILNPTATAMTERRRDDVIAAFRARFDTTVLPTTHRGHARDAAASATTAEFDAVAVLGGDGTVNEVVNGFNGDPAGFSGTSPETPVLAVVPSGSANVFARSLGLPGSTSAALLQTLHLLRSGTRRTVNLAHTHGHWFTFNAGLGLDADVIASVHAARAEGKSASPIRYVAHALRAWRANRDAPPSLRLTTSAGECFENLPFAFVTNASPWTYLGPLPTVTNPECSWDNGLSVYAARALSLGNNLRMVGSMLIPGASPSPRDVVRRDDLASLTAVSPEPIRLQVDGDDMGTVESATFISVPESLQVVAPTR